MRLMDEYASWNRTIAEALFPPLEVPALVFLDLEGNALELIAEDRGVKSDEVVQELVSVVRKLLNTETLTSTFGWFAAQTRRWSAQKDLSEPPALALLTLFALGAARMESGDGMRASNYYGQLSRLLDIDEKRVGAAYRNVSDLLWDSLGTWLNQFGGVRGLPVTFAIGEHPYVGRARAQALVRDADRRRLQSFFQEFDLSPYSSMTEDQLEPLLAQWMEMSHAPSRQLVELWNKDEVRPHLIAAVSNVLATWDGHLSDRDDTGIIASRIRLALDRVRLRRAVNLSFILEVPRYEEARQAKLRTAEGEVSIALVPGRPGEMVAPELRDVLTPQALLEGVVEITDQHAGELVRKPRRLIVLRQDPMSGSWIEVSQVRLGDEIKILIRQDYDVTDILGDISGTDWTIQVGGELPGLPEGWALIEGIVIVGRPAAQISAFDDRNVLIPITQIAFDFSSGLQIPTPPGAKPHYHCDAPPGVTASANGEPFRLLLFDLTDGTPILVQEPWESREGDPIIANLKELELDPGHYGFSLNVGGTERSKEFFLLRSGALAGTEWRYQTVAHDSDDPLFAVNRMRDRDSASEYLVQGLPNYSVEDAPMIDQSVVEQLTPTPWWRRERHKRSTYVNVPVLDQSSCIWTGRHRELIETSVPDEYGKHRGVSIGVCQGCGRQKRYFNSYWRNHMRWRRKREQQDIENERPKRVTTREKSLGTSVDWDLVLDLVIIVGGGDANVLRRITKQFDPSARFYHEFVTTLETLGHIEVRRDLHSGEITEWETAPTSVVDTGDRRRLVGHWTAEDLKHLEQMGIPLQRHKHDDGPSLVTTSATAEEIEEASPGNFVVKNPAEVLAASLPPLRDVIAEIPLTTLPNPLRWERYDALTDAWVQVFSVDEPGAYRTGGYQRQYFLVDEESVNTHQGRLVNVPTAKHASAMMDHRYPPLMSYSREERQLIVPLGAPLPGMYGRSATLASGRPPRRRDLPGVGSYVVYHDIVPELAERLAGLIGE